MKATLTIRKDPLRDSRVIVLLEQHLALMAAITPPESIHALDLDGLRAPGVTAWAAWEGDTVLGCGALKELNSVHGEIKSMHTAAASRGQGVGSALLLHILTEAQRRGYDRLSLETGSTAEFEPARTLYERHGFSYCPPFGTYKEDVNSSFMTLALEG